MKTIVSQLLIKSTSLVDQEDIPIEFTCEGANINPSFSFHNIPEGTQSLALIMEDPDAPKRVFTHWLVWDILPGEIIEANSTSGIQGKNDFAEIGYGGPCPPTGVHRYIFTVYALDSLMGLHQGSSKNELTEAMKGHILASAVLTGFYRKKLKSSL